MGKIGYRPRNRQERRRQAIAEFFSQLRVLVYCLLSVGLLVVLLDLFFQWPVWPFIILGIAASIIVWLKARHHT